MIKVLKSSRLDITRAVLCAGVILCLFCHASLAQNQGFENIQIPPDIKEFGLRKPTEKEVELADLYTGKIVQVFPNELAIDRIKEGKNSSELYDLALPRPAKSGQEYIFQSDRIGDEEIHSSDFPPSSLPDAVDNSASSAFPPIRSQGGLNSCAVWSTTYYMLTYELARARGLVASAGDNSVISSPKFIYNLVNGGENVGTWPSSNLYALSIIGAPSWNSLPYDADFQTIPSGTAMWRSALQRKSFPVIGNLSDPTGDLTESLLHNVKTLLANGSLAELSMYINSWRTKRTVNDPSTADDDLFSNQLITSYSDNRNLGGHSMTVVGYNDNIWNDINGNSIVDQGEKGAFKIANSWGSGWGNSGFIWVSYDAMRSISTVPTTASWPPSDRGLFGFLWGRIEFQSMLINPNYKPQMIADIDITSNKLRHVLLSSVGTKLDGTTVPRSIPILSNIAGGNNNSLESPRTISIAIDLTDLIYYGEQDSPTKWGAKFINSNLAGASTTISKFDLFQRQGSSYIFRSAASGLPVTLSTQFQSDTRQINWNFTPIGVTPDAQLSAPNTAELNTIISLDASGSSDSESPLHGYRFLIDGPFETFSISPLLNHFWQYPNVPYGSSIKVRLQAIDSDGNVKTVSKNIVRQAPGATPTSTPTWTPTSTPTLTPVLSPTPTRSPTFTATPTKTPTISLTFTPSATPSNTTTPTVNPSPTLTPTQQPTGILQLPPPTATDVGGVIVKLAAPKISVAKHKAIVIMKNGADQYRLTINSKSCGSKTFKSLKNIVKIFIPNNGGNLSYQTYSGGKLTARSYSAKIPKVKAQFRRSKSRQCSLLK